LKENIIKPIRTAIAIIRIPTTLFFIL
jgi:hypothetical protein